MNTKLAIKEVVGIVKNIGGLRGAKLKNILEYIAQKFLKRKVGRALKAAVREGALKQKKGYYKSAKRSLDFPTKKRNRYKRVNRRSETSTSTSALPYSNTSADRAEGELVGMRNELRVNGTLKNKWKNQSSFKNTSRIDDSARCSQVTKTIKRATKRNSSSNSNRCGNDLIPSKRSRLLKVRDSLELIRGRLSTKSSNPMFSMDSTPDIFSKTGSSHSYLQLD